MNMKPEYRAELKLLSRAKRKIKRDYLQFVRPTTQQIARLDRSLKKAARATDRELAKIDRRISILEGRLS